MSQFDSARWVYNETVRMFAIPGVPEHEDPAEMQSGWGRNWGVTNDIGALRSVLVRRPGPEMNVVDPTRRINEIGSFGDRDAGWYFQSRTPPDLPLMQSQHDGLVAALRSHGVEVLEIEGDVGSRLKSCYTRDPFFMVEGGAIVCRMGTRIRRGEELVVTRRLAELGIPILRTLSGSAVMEGGSFAWLDRKTAVIGCGVRVNREGAAQVFEILRRQGVELIVTDLVGYDIHIDGALLMIDRGLALVDPRGLTYGFLETLRALGIRTIELHPDDNGWAVNSLAVAPGELIMPADSSPRTLDQLHAADVRFTLVPYDAMHLNGGGIHCSTMPLLREAA